jgi:hypothetical protein
MPAKPKTKYPMKERFSIEVVLVTGYVRTAGMKVMTILQINWKTVPPLKL